MLKQSQRLKLLQKISPQQIQFIKLLQIPTATMEQRIKEELEKNSALEDEKMMRSEDDDDDLEAIDAGVLITRLRFADGHEFEIHEVGDGMAYEEFGNLAAPTGPLFLSPEIKHDGANLLRRYLEFTGEDTPIPEKLLKYADGTDYQQITGRTTSSDPVIADAIVPLRRGSWNWGGQWSGSCSVTSESAARYFGEKACEDYGKCPDYDDYWACEDYNAYCYWGFERDGKIRAHEKSLSPYTYPRKTRTSGALVVSCDGTLQIRHYYANWLGTYKKKLDTTVPSGSWKISIYDGISLNRKIVFTPHNGAEYRAYAEFYDLPLSHQPNQAFDPFD